jgi:DNA-binding NtrC family response regulator
MKILVADDDPVVLASCRRVLQAEGFEVAVAADAEAALAIVEGESFDLILVDVKMPGRGGIWLIQEIKERRPAVPVIAISGYPTADTVADVFAQGVSGFVAKPFTPDELLEAVRGFHQGATEWGHAGFW